MRTPYDQGYNAYLAGKDIGANPFHGDTDEALDWNDGFNQAIEENDHEEPQQ